MEDIAVFQFEKCLLMKIHSLIMQSVDEYRCEFDVQFCKYRTYNVFFVVKGLNMVTWPSLVDIAKGGTFYLSS